jgi:gamma-glutamyltranspeptidase/glutathione hydrolase
MRDFQKPGRSTVYATRAMAATSMPQATLAAIETLRAGGNALDAAVTAAAVLAVIEPQSTGIGGDCFCLYKPAGGEVIALNGSGRTAAAASFAALQAAGVNELSPTSPHAVTIPGAVSAWAALLSAHGRRGLDAALAPAIRYAEEGYVVAPRVAFDWAMTVEKLRATGADGLLPGGAAPAAGTVMRNPGLARTLRMIAKHGPAAFYEGEVADAMVAALRARGGLQELADFAAGATAAAFVNPIAKDFAGATVWECPPNGSGIVALMILGILDGFPRSREPLDVRRVHRHIEAAKLVYRDRNAFVADPAFADVPVEHLLSDAYLDGLRALIRDDRSMTDMPPPGQAHADTVYLCVVDEDGNACSFINSLFENFGSGIVAGETGVVLHNRGLGFNMIDGHPNCIGAAKRPMHTIIPALVTQAGEAQSAFGVMGAHYQPMGQSYVLDSMRRYGLDPQTAIDLPRYFPNGNVVELETGISASLRTGLAALGHQLAILDKPHGGAQAIVIDRVHGVLAGGSDPRKDGCVIGY